MRGNYDFHILVLISASPWKHSLTEFLISSIKECIDVSSSACIWADLCKLQPWFSVNAQKDVEHVMLLVSAPLCKWTQHGYSPHRTYWDQWIHVVFLMLTHSDMGSSNGSWAWHFITWVRSFEGLTKSTDMAARSWPHSRIHKSYCHCQHWSELPSDW